MNQNLALALLVTLATGGLVWVFIYPFLSGERQAEQRKDRLAKPDQSPRHVVAKNAGKGRRELVEETLKDLEVRQRKAKNPPLTVQLEQAGLSWTKRQFYLFSAALGIVSVAVSLATGSGIYVTLAAGFVSGFGVPRWFVTFLKNKRQKDFLNRFPDAVDVIVRGVKAGLTLADCMKIVCSDGQEPIRTEFARILETQAVGVPLGEACTKLYDRIRVPEANFFGIVISIQQKAGGNLSETLGNLSRVLRDRKKMKAKIQAMSMEAKASAMIIASLPFAVMMLVYITSPNYIELLWTSQLGRMMMAACVMWMSIGVLVMRKMINFDF